MRRKKATETRGPETVIALPDIHTPRHDEPAMSAVLAFLADTFVDRVIQLGDLLDMNAISSHNRGQPRLVRGESIENDYYCGNLLLDRITKAARTKNPDCRIILLEGNHEFRVERYLDEHPEAEGLLEVPRGLRLDERGIEWVPCYSEGKLYKVGQAYFHHGLYTNQYHARKMVDAFGVNIFYGHLHSIQCFPKVCWGTNSALIGQSLGHLAEPDQPYMRGRPTAWQHAFGIFYIDRTNGSFNHYVPTIRDGRFIAPNGKTYGA